MIGRVLTYVRENTHGMIIGFKLKTNNVRVQNPVRTEFYTGKDTIKNRQLIHGREIVVGFDLKSSLERMDRGLAGLLLPLQPAPHPLHLPQVLRLVVH